MRLVATSCCCSGCRTADVSSFSSRCRRRCCGCLAFAAVGLVHGWQLVIIALALAWGVAANMHSQVCRPRAEHAAAGAPRTCHAIDQRHMPALLAWLRRVCVRTDVQGLCARGVQQAFPARACTGGLQGRAPQRTWGHCAEAHRVVRLWRLLSRARHHVVKRLAVRLPGLILLPPAPGVKALALLCRGLPACKRDMYSCNPGAAATNSAFPQPTVQRGPLFQHGRLYMRLLQMLAPLCAPDLVAHGALGVQASLHKRHSQPAVLWEARAIVQVVQLAHACKQGLAVVPGVPGAGYVEYVCISV